MATQRKVKNIKADEDSTPNVAAAMASAPKTRKAATAGKSRPLRTSLMFVLALGAMAAVAVQVMRSVGLTEDARAALERRAPQAPPGMYTDPSATSSTVAAAAPAATSAGSATAQGTDSSVSQPTNLSPGSDGTIIDPRTPPGTVRFSVPVSSQNPAKLTFQAIGQIMNITWQYYNVAIMPTNITIQYYPPLNWQQTIIGGGYNTSRAELWRSVAVNVSATPSWYAWNVDVPAGQGYTMRIFDSQLGPNAQQAGRMLTGVSDSFTTFVYTDPANDIYKGGASTLPAPGAVTAAALSAFTLLLFAA
ncbi:hypothetical protein RI367_007444 [Sorochytrium milnesiophthora]